METKEKKGAPAELVAERARRLIRLAPKARKVVGKNWFFDNRLGAGFLGSTLGRLSHTFENQEHVLDFIEAATPEAVKALALKALAFDAVMRDITKNPVELADETRSAVDAAWAATI